MHGSLKIMKVHYLILVSDLEGCLRYETVNFLLILTQLISGIDALCKFYLNVLVFWVLWKALQY